MADTFDPTQFPPWYAQVSEVPPWMASPAQYQPISAEFRPEPLRAPNVQGPGVAGPTTPNFDPMAGLQRSELPVAATQAEAAPAPEPTLAGMLGALTPEQRAAMASRMVNVGGGGGGGSRSVSVRRTPQLPEYNARLGDVESQGLAALQQEQQAKQEQAKQEALAYRGYQTALKARDTAFASREAEVQAKMAAHEARADAARAEVAAMKEDPDRWWGSRSTGQKIGLVLSAALSGFVQGFRGQAGPNPTIALINEAIDRDIISQRASIAKKGGEASTEQGIVRDLAERLGDMRQAEIQARQMYLEGVNTRLKEIAATSGSEQAVATANKLGAEFSQQILRLKNQSYALAQGERTETRTATSGPPAQKVPLLQLLQAQALKQQQTEAAFAKARLDTEKSKSELADLNTPSSKPTLKEGAPIDAMQRTSEARRALTRLWAESREIWMGRRELYGKSPFGSTWKSRLENLANVAGEAMAQATGRSKEEWRRSLLGRWDNAQDINQRLGDANNALGDRMESFLDSAGIKYNTDALRRVEQANRFRFKALTEMK